MYSRICSNLLEKYPSEPLTTQLLTKKFFNLKRTHEKILLKKCSVENYDVQWKFFDTMTKLLSSSTANEVVIDMAKHDSSLKFEYAWKDAVTYRFLDLYLERIEDFKNPKIRNKTLFRSIANSLKHFFPDLSLTERIVQKKFYNMKRTYLDIVHKKSVNKKYPINWKFFNKVHVIMSLTEQIKVEYVTLDYEDADEGDFEDQSAKRFKRECTQTDVEDINFEEYVEYDHVEYDTEDNGSFGDKQDTVIANKSATDVIPMVSKFTLEMDQHDDLDDDIDSERVVDEELDPNVDEVEEVIDEEEDDHCEDVKQYDSSHLEDQRHSSDVFTITTEVPSTSKNELTPFMKAKLDIEGGIPFLNFLRIV